MRRTLSKVATIATLALPLCAFAGPGKPGLWAVTTQMNFTKGGPQIPPEQLARMKQMGIQLPFGQPITSRQCITAEQAARDTPPKVAREDSGCQMENIKHTSDSFSADMICGGNMNGTGQMKVTYSSSEQYTGSFAFQGQTRDAGAVEMNNSFSGQWLATDCGGVKPGNW